MQFDTSLAFGKSAFLQTAVSCFALPGRFNLCSYSELVKL